jgi:hypothetical protein
MQGQLTTSSSGFAMKLNFNSKIVIFELLFLNNNVKKIQLICVVFVGINHFIAGSFGSNS